MEVLSQNNSLSDKFVAPPRHQGRNFFIPRHICEVQTNKPWLSFFKGNRMFWKSAGIFGKGLLCQETEQNLWQYFMNQKSFWVSLYPSFSQSVKQPGIAWDKDDNSDVSSIW